MAICSLVSQSLDSSHRRKNIQLYSFTFCRLWFRHDENLNFCVLDKNLIQDLLFSRDMLGCPFLYSVGVKDSPRIIVKLKPAYAFSLGFSSGQFAGPSSPVATLTEGHKPHSGLRATWIQVLSTLPPYSGSTSFTFI